MILKLSDEKFIHPLSDINLIDLSNYLASMHGVKKTLTKDLRHLIPDHDHTIFVLLDGLGMNLISSLEDNHFFKKNFKTKIHSVFPTTTSVCLTSLSTGAYPTSHGICGWWTYLPSKELDIVPLPFKERFSELNLSDKKIDVSDVFLEKSHYAKFTSDVFGYSHKGINGSTYSKYSIGYRDSTPYENFADCTSLVLENIKKTKQKSFHYLYFSGIDHNFHTHGKNSVEVQTAIHEATTVLGELVTQMPKNSKVVITADHGLIDIDKKNKLIIRENDSLFKYLKTPPTCEPRVPIFHVTPGFEKKFKRAFNKRFGEHFKLISKYDLKKSKLIGVGPLQNRFGDFVALPKTPSILTYERKGHKEPSFIGYHGGLTKDEMHIPLIVI